MRITDNVVRYLVLFEPQGTHYFAYVPDLPGCTATGQTLAEAEMNIKEVIRSYQNTHHNNHLPPPPPKMYYAKFVTIKEYSSAQNLHSFLLNTDKLNSLPAEQGKIELTD